MYFESLKDLQKSDIFHEQDAKAHFMILVGKDTQSELCELTELFNLLGIKYFGGIFPKLIANGQAQSTGFIVKKLNPIYSECVYPYLMKGTPKLEPGKKYTGILLADGLSDKIKDMMDTVVTRIQGEINYIGGCGARYTEEWGIPSLQQGAALFNNAGFFKDAFHLCIIEKESITDIALGWEVLNGPFKITHMNHNIVCELDYENPYELYSGNIEAFDNTVIVQNNPFIFTSYPIALVENGKTKNVILPDDFTGEGYVKFTRVDLKEGDELYILRGDHDSLIRGVEKAVSGTTNPETEITVFSCFTREIVLDDKFPDEIQCIDEKHILTSEGTLSFGEFSNSNEEGELRLYAGACIITSV